MAVKDPMTLSAKSYQQGQTCTVIKGNYFIWLNKVSFQFQLPHHCDVQLPVLFYVPVLKCLVTLQGAIYQMSSIFPLPEIKLLVSLHCNFLKMNTL